MSSKIPTQLIELALNDLYTSKGSETHIGLGTLLAQMSDDIDAASGGGSLGGDLVDGGRVIHVRPNGEDSSADGSLNKPFFTGTAALAYIALKVDAGTEWYCMDVGNMTLAEDLVPGPKIIIRGVHRESCIIQSVDCAAGQILASEVYIHTITNWGFGPFNTMDHCFWDNLAISGTSYNFIWNSWGGNINLQDIGFYTQVRCEAYSSKFGPGATIQNHGNARFHACDIQGSTIILEPSSQTILRVSPGASLTQNGGSLDADSASIGGGVTVETLGNTGTLPRWGSGSTLKDSDLRVSDDDELGTALNPQARIHSQAKSATALALIAQASTSEGGAGLAPDDLSIGPKVWLVGSALGALSEDDPISLWSDSSGNGYDAVPTNASLKPAYDADIGTNGTPGVKLEFSTHKGVENTTIPAPGINPFSATIVFKHNTNGVQVLWTIGEQHVTDSGGASIDLLQCYLISNSIEFNRTRGQPAGSRDYEKQVNFGATIGTALHIITTSMSSNGLLTVWLDGILVGTSPGWNHNIEAAGYGVGGGQDVANSVGDGSIGEWIYYEGQLSSADIVQLHAALGIKYGITTPPGIIPSESDIQQWRNAEGQTLLALDLEGAVAKPLHVKSKSNVPTTTISAGTVTQSSEDIDWQDLVNFSQGPTGTLTSLPSFVNRFALGNRVIESGDFFVEMTVGSNENGIAFGLYGSSTNDNNPFAGDSRFAFRIDAATNFDVGIYENGTAVVQSYGTVGGLLPHVGNGDTVRIEYSNGQVFYKVNSEVIYISNNSPVYPAYVKGWAGDAPGSTPITNANQALYIEQTADLTQWKDSAGTVLSAIKADGKRTFTPAVPSDWDVTPTTVEDALNELAARLRAIE